MFRIILLGKHKKIIQILTSSPQNHQGRQHKLPHSITIH